MKPLSFFALATKGCRRTCASPPQRGTSAVEPNVYAEPTHMNCWPFKSRMIVGSAAPIPVYTFFYPGVASVQRLRQKKKEMIHKFYCSQEDRKCQGEYDAPKLPILRHTVVDIWRQILLEGF